MSGRVSPRAIDVCVFTRATQGKRTSQGRGGRILPIPVSVYPGEKKSTVQCSRTATNRVEEFLISVLTRIARQENEKIRNSTIAMLKRMKFDEPAAGAIHNEQALKGVKYFGQSDEE